MEIIDYLRIARRRWWILVLVPVLAAGAALGLILMQPPTYTATATVSTGTLVGSDGSPFAGTQGVQQFTGAFTAAGQNPRTRAAVEAATGVPPGVQADAVALDPVGTSADMQVDVTLPRRDQAGPVASETAKQALRLLFEVRAKEAAASRDSAQQAATAANAAVAELAKKYQIADPPQAYQAQLNQVTALLQQQANLRAQGNAIAAAALDDPINKAKAELAAYLPIIAEYQELAGRQSAANNDLTQAQAQYRLAASLASAATADSVVYLGPTAETDRSATLVTTVPTVFGAGLFLAVVLIMLIEIVGRIRGSQRANQNYSSALADLGEGEEWEAAAVERDGARVAAEAPVQMQQPSAGVESGHGWRARRRARRAGRAAAASGHGDSTASAPAEDPMAAISADDPDAEMDELTREAGADVRPEGSSEDHHVSAFDDLSESSPAAEDSPPHPVGAQSH